MSLAVVRCPACGGSSRVPADALGQMVGCPRCQSPFVAAEDAPEAPLPSRADDAHARTGSRPARGAPRPAAVIPVAPPRRSRPELVWEDATPEPTSDAVRAIAVEVPDPEHDPHTPPVGGLPVSVLVGFALMPFGIPLLWLVAPLVTGASSSLSPAVPAALAVAAAALCLGVVYTIDWTAATRIKGVLMLVGLAYLTGAGLFFLKKDLLDRAQKFFVRSPKWGWVQPKDASWKVRMPRPVREDKQQPLPGLVPLPSVWHARHASEVPDEPGYEYRFATGKSDPAESGLSEVWFPALREHIWFARVGERAKRKDEQVARAGEPITSRHATEPDGRQWTFESGDGRTVRIVQVFVIENRVYYLSAEGPGLKADEHPARQFFDSFEVFPPKK